MKTEPYRSRSLAPGLAVSLLIHAGLFALLASQRPPSLPTQPVRWLTVSLVPAPKAPIPVAAPEPAPVIPALPRQLPEERNKTAARAQPRSPAPPVARQRRPADDERQREATAITVVPSPSTQGADPPDPFAAPPTSPAKPAGTFDTNAALQSARKLAIAKAGKDDPAVAQLRDKPINELATENEAGKGIKRATRPDCLTSASGAGILAPLLIAAQVLTDKKDHGCKW